MSLKRNIFVNYTAQIYITIVTIVMLPVYIKYMGVEAYGLVGFFMTLQAWFILLDMGLTLTMSRETARFRGGASDPLNYRSFVRALEGIFATIALISGGVIFLSAGFISEHWLKVQKLPIIEIKSSIELMAATIALRWISGLYRGAISGSEQLVWLGGYNSLIATLRFFGVLLVLKFVGVSPVLFFGYQLFIAAIELLILLFKAYSIFPPIPDQKKLTWSLSSLKPVLKFSLSLAFPTIAWILVTQTDKLVLSRILSLTDYGYFSLAVLVAGGIILVSEPISAAIMPRMTKLEAEGDQKGLIHIYRYSTQLVTILAGATALTMTLCAEPLLWVWTGDLLLAQQTAATLILYALGNGILAISAFPFYLQYAKGDLRLHVIGNILFVAVLIPTMIWAANAFGAIGAGYVWLGMNLLTFTAWLPIVHHRLIPGLNLKWYGHDILLILLAMATAGYFLNGLLPQTYNRSTQLIKIIVIGGSLMVVGAAASSFVRSHLLTILRSTK